MATIEIDLDLPEGIEVRGYERIEQGHAFEIEWAIPATCVCDRCGYSERTCVEYKDKIHVIRDLDLWDQPSFFVYQPPFHRCSRCNRRQWLLPPIKRKHVTYTYRFEHQVLRMLIGSTEEEVARRLGISAEMVHVIVKNQLKEEQQIDPDRVITDVGMDEISLKKRHKLYATILTDLTDPNRPQVLAVAAGRDRAAAEKCLDCLTPEQREQVRVHRTDMSPAYASACAAKLPHSQQTIDRFHVAQKLGKMADRARKKDPCVQEDPLDESKEGFQVQHVGVS
jgi:transposase